jgi:hypothetical protein
VNTPATTFDDHGLDLTELEPIAAPEVVALFIAAVALGFAIGKRMFGGKD